MGRYQSKDFIKGKRLEQVVAHILTIKLVEIKIVSIDSVNEVFNITISKMSLIVIIF
jgi:hypothetical protein